MVKFVRNLQITKFTKEEIESQRGKSIKGSTMSIGWDWEMNLSGLMPEPVLVIAIALKIKLLLEAEKVAN